MEPLAVPKMNDVEPIETIVDVHSPVMLIRCDPLPPLRQALVTRDKAPIYIFEVCQHLDREHIRALSPSKILPD